MSPTVGIPGTTKINKYIALFWKNFKLWRKHDKNFGGYFKFNFVITHLINLWPNSDSGQKIFLGDTINPIKCLPKIIQSKSWGKNILEVIILGQDVAYEKELLKNFVKEMSVEKCLE